MKITIKLIFLLFIIINYSNAGALNSAVKNSVKVLGSFIKSNKSLPSSKIRELSKIVAEPKGTEKIGKILGKMNLPKDVLEDTYMRMAVYRGKITQKEAKELFINLRGTRGFRTTLSKVIGNNIKGSKGHLNELKIANKASKNGFKVLDIGKKFDDGIKSKDSDIDVLLKRKNKVFAIEAKDYLPSTNIKLDKLKGDIDTLVAYKKQNPNQKIIPIFTLTNKPNSQEKFELLKKYAQQRGVEIIVGNPQEQIQQIKILGDIL